MKEKVDREKVIKGLECCLGSNDCDVEPKEDCPYKGMCLCAMALRFDVLSLLKEQEAVEPTFKQDEDGIVWDCGSCGAHMYHNGGISKAKEYAKYCRQCGRKVKWE